MTTRTSLVRLWRLGVSITRGVLGHFKRLVYCCSESERPGNGAAQVAYWHGAGRNAFLASGQANGSKVNLNDPAQMAVGFDVIKENEFALIHNRPSQGVFGQFQTHHDSTTGADQ